MTHMLQRSDSSSEMQERQSKDSHKSAIILQRFNWLISLSECLSDLGTSFACLQGSILSESLEFNFTYFSIFRLISY